MNDYFYKYLETKMSLLKFILQFYDHRLLIEKADKLNIEYNENDIKFGLITCYFHNYSSEGEYLWNLLNIEKPIITYDELNNIRENIKQETFDNNIDYELSYLKNLLKISYMVERYYKTKIEIEKADKLNIEYDLDYDELDGVLDVYYHICESCGEYAWNLLDIEQKIITSSQMYKKQQQLIEKLLEKDVKIKQKNNMVIL